ncbi:MAG: tRNA (N6-isopentenyl adenosine(37)-C2)-methylthiotransferase MiaB, partial [Acidobacteriota bacterium]
GRDFVVGFSHCIMTTAMNGEHRNFKFYIRTFGCQMNESDSERIAGLLGQTRAARAERPEEADLIIVNTCAVREKSEEKLFSYLGRLAQLKKKKNIRVGVVGCVAQLRGLEFLEQKPVVDFVLGPDNYTEILGLIQPGRAEKYASTSWSREWRETAPELIVRESAVSAYLTVMEGCNNFCAYCIVPYTRGREKFRPLRSILEETRDLGRRGFLEVQLLGQNVNSYRDPESGKDFAALLREAGGIEGVEWVRFLTSHPKNFTPAIAAAMAETKKVCRQIHLPLQAGSTAVLRKMKRGYSKQAYLDIVADLRRLMPGISLSTDVIVGFPGETEKDFEETIAVLSEVRFTNIFSFRYSPRPQTSAMRHADDVPAEEKRRRLGEVQRLQRQIQAEDHRKQLGRVMRVLCLGRGKKTPQLFSGRNEGHQVVNFQSAEDCSGRFVEVLITGFGPYSLLGERIPSG